MINKGIILSWLAIIALWVNVVFAANTQTQAQNKQITFEVQELIHPSSITELNDVLEMEEQHWTPYEMRKHVQGFVSSSWIRIKIENLKSHVVFRLLELENTMHDPLFMALVSRNKSSGSWNISNMDAVTAFLPASIFIPLTLPKKEQIWVYIHMHSSEFFPLDVFLWNNQDALQHIQSRSSIEGIQKGMIVALGGSSLLLVLSTWSLSYMIYALITLLMFIFYSATHGYFPYEVMSYPLPLILIPLCFVLFAWFTQSLFNLKSNARTLYQLNRFALFISLIQLLVYLTSFRTVSFNTLILINFIPLLTMIGVGLGCIKQKMDGALLYVLGWSVVVLSLCTVVHQTYTSHPDVSFIYNILVLGSMLKMLWWKAALLKRLQSQRIEREKEQQQALEQQKHVQLTQEIALKAEEKANHKLERLILERTQKLEQTMQELHSANLKLAEQSTIDSLTGIKNKKAFDEYIYTEGLHSKREKKPLSLVMVDIDHFKTINDDFGHLAGDHVLKLITPAMQNVLKRPKDFLARFGGEEFAIVLPNTTAEGAMHVAEAIRLSLEQLEIFWDGKGIPVTASLGVTSRVIEKSEDIFMLIDTADQGMYQSKTAGRNQVFYLEYKSF